MADRIDGPFIIYGKRTGLINPKTNQPIYDKQFRALDSWGIRVNKLSDAMAYATREDAQAHLDTPGTKRRILDGLVQFEIRKAR